MLTLVEIRAAERRIHDAVYRTPCARSELLSSQFGTEVHLKLENLQMTGSFKERGACNHLQLSTPEERKAGVITASAGNHAQGVSYHARRLGIHATIVMPLPTALVKISNTRRLGAEVILHGGTFDDAQCEAKRLAEERGLLFVPPFDDERIMAGQGTIGLELLAQVPDLDAVLVPVGGGGLAAGIALAIKETDARLRVIGVEAAMVPSLTAARALGGPVLVEARHSIADGIAVRRVGELCFPLLQRYLDDVITVSEEAIAEAVLTLLEGEKTLAEGAGATALAGLASGRLGLSGKRVAVVVSGGNMDVNLLSRVIDRGLWRTGRLTRLRCVVFDVPGALSSLLGLVARTHANVLAIEHERVGDDLELGQTGVDLLLETRGPAHIEELETVLSEAGVSFEHTGTGVPRRSLRP